MVQVAKDRIGRYEIIYPLAHGGMAEVHVGRLPGMAGFEKFVAIKLIHSHLSKEKQFIKMFLDEARLAASIRHPNVAEIYEVGRDGEAYYMVGELVLGQNLHTTMKAANQQGVSFAEGLSAHIVSQVCLGLHEAHELKDQDGKPLGLVHRDVTPRNILLSYGGYTKLADFGVAWAANKLSHSEVGSIKGKVGFMAPEQIRCEPMDRRCDVFSLGVVLYMMCTGRHPFHADNDAGTLHNIVNGKPIRPSEIASDISPDLEAIILTALANQPGDRYQTAAQMHDDLDEMIQAHEYKFGPAHLSRLMHGMFTAEIEEHERKLRDFRRERGEETGITSVPPPPGEGESQPRLAATIDGFGAGDYAHSGGTAVSRKKKYALLGAVLAAVAVIAAVVLFAVGSGEPAGSAEKTAPVIAATATEPVPPGASEAPPPVVQEGPKEIRLDLGALPVGAEVTLDDKGIEYPFVLPASQKTGRLRITAPGYSPFEVTIPLDRDREVVVAWAKEAAGTGAKSKTKSKVKKQEDEPPVSPKNEKNEKNEVLLPSPFD